MNNKEHQEDELGRLFPNNYFEGQCKIFIYCSTQRPKAEKDTYTYLHPKLDSLRGDLIYRKVEGKWMRLDSTRWCVATGEVVKT